MTTVRAVEIYDTTLRDGSQREGISYTLEDKLRIAKKLDEFGVAFIEGGWPGSNPKDAEFFARVRDTEFRHALVTAFGSTRRAKLGPEVDPSLRAMLEAGTKVCTIFGKSSILHVTQVLRTTLDENLAMIEESVRFLVSEKRRVVYDAEHFFDGYRLDPEYAVETLRAALRGGAETVVLCDTNGGGLPWDIERTASTVLAALPPGSRLGIHAHDDTGCGVSNSLAAVRAGAVHVQGTVNGYGERCGNANLSVIVPNLELKLGVRCLAPGRLLEIAELSRFVAEVANLAPDTHMAYVGKSAFAHKGGVHVAAMRRHADSYQHVDPALVGNQMRVVVSELSGRGNVLSKAEELGVHVSEGSEVETLKEIKEAEARGVSYESAEASVALLLGRKAPDYQPLFSVIEYKVEVGRRSGSDTFAEAVVKLRVGTQTLHTASEGIGPVGALDGALRKALTPVYPTLADIHLADYKVRILDGKDGTQATTRVLIDSKSGERAWSTVGASPNIIQASLEALVDSIEYGLLQSGVRLADAAVAPRDSERPPPPTRAATH
ncbi:MAG TPA: citramalate synthase [Polyangiaceae bacterium]